MRMTLLIHILAGSLGILSGFVALFAAKGAAVHRRAGVVFVYTMLTMATSGLVVTVGRGVAPEVNVPAALLTACLVTTALTTLRRPTAGTRRVEVAAMLVSLGVGVASLAFALQAIAAGGTRNGMPAFPFLLFGVVGVLAGGLDLRVMRSGGVRGPARLARHLWRMSFALFIAALSFFIGQADELPEALRIPPLLALPVLTVLAAMFYWLWRVRARPLAGVVRASGAGSGARPGTPVHPRTRSPVQR